MADLDEWVEALEAELGLPAGTIDVGEVLDLARDAAHAVARPAAPVTTYAVGYAAGLAAAGAQAAEGQASGGPASDTDGGGSAEGLVPEAVQKAIDLANRWEAANPPS